MAALPPPRSIDHDRLRRARLSTSGVGRTPVCALVDDLRLREQICRVMNEVFATIDDARLVLGIVPEEPDDSDTADGMPRTETTAANRLARMIGLDRRTVSDRRSPNLAGPSGRGSRQQIR